MAFLIDSSVFVAIDRQQGTLADLEKLLQDAPFGIASITASEILMGIERSEIGVRRQRREVFVAAVLSSVSILPLDLSVARTHAHIWASLLRQGTMIGHHDLIIAATAVSHQLTVLTHNMREFNRVPELTVQRAEV